MDSREGKENLDAMRRVFAVARLLSATVDLDEILRVIVDALRDTLSAERASVFVYDDQTNELVTTIAHGVGDTLEQTPANPSDSNGAASTSVNEIRLPLGQGLAGEAARTRQLINVPDAYNDTRFDTAVDKQTGFHTRSILTIPLISFDVDLIGVAQVLNKKKGYFDAHDEEIALALASQAAVAIKRARLIEDRLVRHKLERDLHIARSIQRQTFPSSMPDILGYDIAAWSDPADETGGDIYDVLGLRVKDDRKVIVGIRCDVEQVLLLLADATGHGIGPALTVTQLRAMVRMASRAGLELVENIRQINRQLVQDLPDGRFITAWFGLLAADNTTLLSFSTGQAPLIHYHSADHTVTQLSSDTFPLGICEELPDQIGVSVTMKPGDLFVVLSDGFYEAMNSSGRLFGVDAVTAILRQHETVSATGIIEAIRHELQQFSAGVPASDDQTAIVIKRDKPTI